MNAIQRVPWALRFTLCVAIAWGFGTYACVTLADWPLYAAAFNAPLWATIGAAFSDHMHRRTDA